MPTRIAGFKIVAFLFVSSATWFCFPDPASLACLPFPVAPSSEPDRPGSHPEDPARSGALARPDFILPVDKLSLRDALSALRVPRLAEP